jgi:hypothetical protein
MMERSREESKRHTFCLLESSPAISSVLLHPWQPGFINKLRSRRMEIYIEKKKKKKKRKARGGERRREEMG